MSSDTVSALILAPDMSSGQRIAALELEATALKADKNDLLTKNTDLSTKYAALSHKYKSTFKSLARAKETMDDVKAQLCDTTELANEYKKALQQAEAQLEQQEADNDNIFWPEDSRQHMDKLSEQLYLKDMEIAKYKAQWEGFKDWFDVVTPTTIGPITPPRLPKFQTFLQNPPPTTPPMSPGMSRYILSSGGKVHSFNADYQERRAALYPGTKEFEDVINAVEPQEDLTAHDVLYWNKGIDGKVIDKTKDTWEWDDRGIWVRTPSKSSSGTPPTARPTKKVLKPAPRTRKFNQKKQVAPEPIDLTADKDDDDVFSPGGPRIQSHDRLNADIQHNKRNNNKNKDDASAGSETERESDGEAERAQSDAASNPEWWCNCHCGEEYECPEMIACDECVNAWSHTFCYYPKGTDPNGLEHWCPDCWTPSTKKIMLTQINKAKAQAKAREEADAKKKNKTKAQRSREKRKRVSFNDDDEDFAASSHTNKRKRISLSDDDDEDFIVARKVDKGKGIARNDYDAGMPESSRDAEERVRRRNAAAAAGSEDNEDNEHDGGSKGTKDVKVFKAGGDGGKGKPWIAWEKNVLATEMRLHKMHVDGRAREPLYDTHLWAFLSSQLAKHGIDRPAMACKNIWCRELRAKYPHLDERKRKGKLVTSKQ